MLKTVSSANGSNVANLVVTGLTGYMYANNTSPVTASTTIPVSSVSGAVPNTVYVIAGTGLTGGGALTGNVTINSSATGTVTQVQGNGTVNGITLTGNVTTSGNLTLGGTLGSIANSQLANSTFTLGNTTVTLGGTTTTVGNVTLSGANISATTTANATFATSSLPLVPAGYIPILVNGTTVKIPYYAV